MNRTVLIVDDEPTISDALAARLRGEGFDVVTAHDGPSAVETYARVQPDVVVLDVMLPGFDGLEVCRRIQAERSVPVLMLTAKSDENDMLVGLGVGADDTCRSPSACGSWWRACTCCSGAQIAPRPRNCRRPPSVRYASITMRGAYPEPRARFI
jgi:CheY-like chemotaxis protein